MKVMREVTDWAVDYRQPNHVYLMKGDRALAYVPWGKGKVMRLRAPLRLDLRGRRFAEVPDQWGMLEQHQDDVGIRTWPVQGSRGDTYTVSLEDNRWTCTCPGHGFRGRCRHVDEVRTQEAA